MLSDFPITKRWPAADPSVIQLYSLATPNGIKVAAMLEETGLGYEAHKVSFADADQMTPEFLSLNPNNKIPAIIDPHGPDGKAIGLWESGAILIYLAEKTGTLLPSDPVKRAHTLQWLMWQMGGAGPMFGQFGFFFKMGGAAFEDKRPLARYTDEAIRLLGVMDAQLAANEFIAGDAYSIADIALWPWINVLTGFYGAGEHLQVARYPHIQRWLHAALARPASQAALTVPS